MKDRFVDSGECLEPERTDSKPRAYKPYRFVTLSEFGFKDREDFLSHCLSLEEAPLDLSQSTQRLKRASDK